MSPTSRTFLHPADDAPDVRASGLRPRGQAPKSRQGTYGFIDPDDPDAERVIRQHAQATGADPDEAVRQELAGRQSAGASRNLDQVLADERAAAASSSSSPPAAASPPAGPAPQPISSHPMTKWSGSDGAGFLLGLFLYALGLNVVRHGPAGAKAFLRAKFLNKTDTNLSATDPAPANAAPGGGGEPGDELADYFTGLGTPAAAAVGAS